MTIEAGRLDLRCSHCGVTACYGVGERWFCYAHRPVGFLPGEREHAAVAQLVEHGLSKAAVVGSSPTRPLQSSNAVGQLGLF